MDIDFSVEVRHTWVHERPYKVTLTRGASGQYRWEIEVRGAGDFDIVSQTAEIDRRLREQYASIEPTEEEG